jgi:hypothetical protein
MTWKPGTVLSPSALDAAAIEEIKRYLLRNPVPTMALTGWAEARSRLEPGVGWVSNPLDAMCDVINVIDNRVRAKREAGYAEACLRRWQFSCWEPTAGADTNADPHHLADNFEALMDRAQRLLANQKVTPKLSICLNVAEAFYRGTHPDMLSGATHYYATWIAPPTWTRPPAELVLERFGHRFYRKVA